MKIIYECEFCHQKFDNEIACVLHEGAHLTDNERIKFYIIYGLKHNPCDHCIHAYYVYNCEFNCSHKDCNCTNNYKDFVLKEK